MSSLYLKGRRDPLDITFEKAQSLKKLFADKEIANDTVIDVAHLSFRKSEIKTIEATPDRRYTTKDEYRDPTFEENEMAKKYIAQIREEMIAKGIFKRKTGKSVGRYEISHKALEEYKTKYGKEYELKPGERIIDDVSNV